MVLTMLARSVFAKSFRLRPNYGVTGRRVGGGVVEQMGAVLGLAEQVYFPPVVETPVPAVG
jgi:hypothetical protein